MEGKRQILSTLSILSIKMTGRYMTHCTIEKLCEDNKIKMGQYKEALRKKSPCFEGLTLVIGNLLAFLLKIIERIESIERENQSAELKLKM